MRERLIREYIRYTLSTVTFLKAPCKILKLLIDSCSRVDENFTFFKEMQPKNTHTHTNSKVNGLFPDWYELVSRQFIYSPDDL